MGSQSDFNLLSLSEGGTRLGGQERIVQAYDAIVAFHNKYLGQKVDINIVGFSRSAAQSRALANKFIEKGALTLDGQNKLSNRASPFGISSGPKLRSMMRRVPSA